MARILAAMTLLFLLLPMSGQAADNGQQREEAVAALPEADSKAIREVIKAQLEALQHDDAPLAFSYATPMIQWQMGTAEDFLEMVKTAYPAVYHPRDMQFRELEATYNGPMQKVFFFGPDGEPVLGLYYMQQQPDGSWKINGCELAPAPDIVI